MRLARPRVPSLKDDLDQDTHFVEAAAERHQGFNRLLPVTPFVFGKECQQRLLGRPETIGSPFSQRFHLGLQDFRLGILSELIQLSKFPVIFSRQLTEMLKYVIGRIHFTLLH